MKSITTMTNLFYSLSNQPTTTTMTALAQQLINDSIRTVANLRGGKWWWLEGTTDVLTVANQRGYQIPNKYRKLMDVYVTVGQTVYMPEAVFDPNKWKLILAYQLGSSDVPYFYYREGNKILFAPIPATAGNTITIRGRIGQRDLVLADFSTGSVTTATLGSTAIVGTGTAWTKSMVGEFIRITETQAANGGDGQWYEIGSWTDATHMDLVKNYEGTSIAAGTASYTIGDMSLIPQAYDVAPVYRAVAQYWDTQGDTNRSARYWRLYDGGVEAGLSTSYGGLIGQMLENEGEKVEGAYIPPFASTANLVNTGAWWSPWQGDGSGF
jgi:hypothetical protein